VIGVVVATWRTVLVVLGDGPGGDEDRSMHDGTADDSGGPGPTFDHPGGPSAALAT
jgi:hypothetical protein